MIYPKKKLIVAVLTLAITALPKIAIAQTPRPAIIELISGQGRVRVQREKRYSWTPVRQATELYPGDQILPDKGTKVYVRCYNASKLVIVKAGVPSGLGSICPIWTPRSIRSKLLENSFFRENTILGGIDNSVPYLITPRNSIVLSPTPLIRWNRVSGATEYTVEITRLEGLMWRNTTKENQLTYAGKSLQPGERYKIIVTSNTKKSSEGYFSLIGGTNASIPYLITPRNSIVLSPTPLIRWNRVSGATEYTVEITGLKGLMWRKTTKETQLTYAGKPLLPGERYLITVQTDTEKSSQEDLNIYDKKRTTHIGFTIIDTLAADILQEKIDGIISGCFSIEVCDLILARFYRDYVINAYFSIADEEIFYEIFRSYKNLNSEAIAVLESLLEKGKESPLIYRNLGDLYLISGVFRSAESNYLKAINLSQQSEDLEDRTLAHYTLGQMYTEIGDLPKALQHYKQAQYGYAVLGDFQVEKFIQERITQIQQTGVSVDKE